MLISGPLQELHPGDAIQLTDATELPVFEDMVAEQIDPVMTQNMRDAWAGRAALKDLLRPPTFNGTIANIQLVVMDEPYDRLLDARERGWRFSNAGGSPRAGNMENANAETFHGFTYLASATSSGRNVVSQVQSEIWYGKVPSHDLKDVRHSKGAGDFEYEHKVKSTKGRGGASIRRFVAKPVIEQEAIMELNETSRQIGFEVLRYQMTHPIVQPLRS